MECTGFLETETRHPICCPPLRRKCGDRSLSPLRLRVRLPNLHEHEPPPLFKFSIKKIRAHGGDAGVASLAAREGNSAASKVQERGSRRATRQTRQKISALVRVVLERKMLPHRPKAQVSVHAADVA